MAESGDFVWFDLMARDEAAAVAFYTKVVGWGTSAWDMGSQVYTMWALPGSGNTIGGLMKLPDEAAAAGAPPHWLSYLLVPDVDAAAARVPELGGRVHLPPTDIPTVGRFSVISDPQGAALALFQALDPAGMNSSGGPPGAVVWVELTTTDHEAAFRFYEALAGWRKVDVLNMGPAGDYVMFAPARGNAIGGMWTRTPEMQVPPNWLPYFHVGAAAAVDDAVARITAAGGKVFNGPMDIPGGGRVLMAFDDQGGTFALHGRDEG